VSGRSFRICSAWSSASSGSPREHALVEALGRRQRRAVREHHAEELQPLDVAAEHDEADGQRRGEQQPTATHSQVQKIAATTTEKAKARCLAEGDGLDHVAHERLADEVERRRPERHGPAGVHCRGEGDRRQAAMGVPT
jgi:hypothetical protein